MRRLPDSLYAAIKDLSDAQLDTPYREGGWTVRQLVHHIADSHMNSFIRFKFALTEDTPTIMPYDQDSWVHMADASQLDPMISVDLLRGIHKRLVHVLEHMSDSDFKRELYHPDWGRI